MYLIASMAASQSWVPAHAAPSKRGAIRSSGIIRDMLNSLPQHEVRARSQRPPQAEKPGATTVPMKRAGRTAYFSRKTMLIASCGSRIPPPPISVTLSTGPVASPIRPSVRSRPQAVALLLPAGFCRIVGAALSVRIYVAGRATQQEGALGGSTVSRRARGVLAASSHRQGFLFEGSRRCRIFVGDAYTAGVRAHGYC